MREKLFHKMITVWGLTVLWTVIGLPAVMTGNPQDTTTLQATVKISSPPLNLSSDTPLDFGQVRSGETDGSVVLSPDPLVLREPFGGAGIAGDASAPAFVSVSGAANTSFSVLFPEMVQVVFHDGSTQHFLDATFFMSESDTRGDSASGVGLTNETGNDTIRIGGTILIPAGALQGNYEGTINLQVVF